MEPRSLVAAIDQGTTSSRCILFDRSGRPVASHQLGHAQITPRPGWVEHDADEILERVRTCIRVALREVDADGRALAAVGISDQRETTVVWSRTTGRPVEHAIVWQDTRTADACARLAAADPLGMDRFRALTGLPISTYSSALKLASVLEAGGPDRRSAAESGDLLFGTIDSWLIWHLTGGPGRGVHVTDVTNASRTMLMGLETLAWEPELLDAVGVPAAMLPAIRSSSEVYGEGVGDLAGVPIAGDLGDQQAALFGQACFEAGQIKCTYGTGCFMLMHTGDRPVPSRHGLITTVAARLGRGIRDLRPRGLGGGGRRAHRLAARQPRDHRRRRRGRGARPFRAGQRRRRLRAGLLRPVRAALAERCPGRHRRADRPTRRAVTSPGPRSNRPRTRSTTWASRWPPTWAGRCPTSCGWTAG